MEKPEHYLLTYDLAPDYLALRGERVLAGALAGPADQALLVFDRASAEPGALFAAQDPCVTHGLVRAFHVRQWNTVVGEQAGNPLRPA